MVVYQAFCDEEMCNFIAQHQDVVVCVYHKWYPEPGPSTIFESLSVRYPQLKFLRIQINDMDSMDVFSDAPEFYIYMGGNLVDELNVQQHSLEECIIYSLSNC